MTKVSFAIYLNSIDQFSGCEFFASFHHHSAAYVAHVHVQAFSAFIQWISELIFFCRVKVDFKLIFNGNWADFTLP